MSTARIKIDLLLATFLHLFQKAVGYILLAILARHFEQATMGQLFFAQAMALLMAMPTELGTHKHLARAVAADPGNAARHLGEVISLRLPLLAAAYVLFNAGAWAAFPETRGLVLLASLHAFLDSLYFSMGVTFTALRRVGLHVGVYALGQLALLALVLAAVLGGAGMAVVVAAYVASSVITAVAAAAVVRREIGAIPVRFDLREMRRLASASAAFFALMFLDLLLAKVDTLMIWFLSTPVAVASYESAYKLLEVSRSVVRPAAMVFLPIFVATASRGDWPGFERLARRLVSVVGLTGFAVSAAVILAAAWILPWVWGEAYASAVPVLRVLFLSVPAVYIAFMAQAMVNALRLERSAIAAMLLAVLGNVALNAALIPTWGAVGAAWTTVISEAVISVLLLRLIRRALQARRQVGPPDAVAGQELGKEACAEAIRS